MYCALKAAKDFGLKEGQRVVVIFPDSVRNYMSKFLSDDWMSQRDFMEREKGLDSSKHWWSNLHVSALGLRAPLTVTPNVTIQETLEILNKEGFDQVPVVDEEGKILGMVTVGNMMSQVVKSKVKKTDSVSKVMYTQFKKVRMHTPLIQLSRMLDTDHFVLVTHEQRHCKYSDLKVSIACKFSVFKLSIAFGGKEKMKDKQMIFGIATRIDLINFITQNQQLDDHPQSPQ
ncbi:hypothetical protein ACJMK2_025856 [Sinanodonta woodiana]|uniref:CBS domain-containing protein n=1 Tax=Sinanodonta woodiana TaxID=1069815 RepID=A0ABD3XLJ1_SINWO